VAFTLATLKEAVNEYTQNTYWGTSTTDQMDTFIRLAEERINYAVQIQNFNTREKTGTIFSVRKTSSLTGPFAITSGTKTLTVTDVAHGAEAGDPIRLSGFTDLLDTAADTVLSSNYINGDHKIVSIADADSYTVTVSSASTGDVGSSSADKGGTGDVEYSFNSTITPAASDSGFSFLGIAPEITPVDSSEMPLDVLWIAMAPYTYDTPTVTYTATNKYVFLLEKEYNFLLEYMEDDTTTGIPKYYSFYNVTGPNNYDPSVATTPSNAPVVEFRPKTAADSSNSRFDYRLLYYFNPPSLVSNTSGTWLSVHGDVALLYGTLFEAYTYLKGDHDLLQLYESRFREAIQGLVVTEGGVYRNETYRTPLPRVAVQ